MSRSSFADTSDGFWNYSKDKMQLKDDPPIAEIRETRHRISEAFGHNPQRIIEYYRQLEKID